MCSVQFSTVQLLSRVRLLETPWIAARPGRPVHHQLPEYTQTHVYRVGDAIQPSHPLSSPSPPAPNPSQHQGLFQWSRRATHLYVSIPVKTTDAPVHLVMIQVDYSGQNFNVWLQQRISSWEFGEVRKQTAKNKFISQVFALPPSSPHQYKLKPNYSIFEKNLILGESYCAFKRTFVVSPKISLEINTSSRYNYSTRGRRKHLNLTDGGAA